jgi:hypothetical protein
VGGHVLSAVSESAAGRAMMSLQVVLYHDPQDLSKTMVSSPEKSCNMDSDGVWWAARQGAETPNFPPTTGSDPVGVLLLSVLQSSRATCCGPLSLQAVSKPQIAFAGKAQPDEKAEHI